MAKRILREINFLEKNLKELTGSQAEIIDTVVEDETSVLLRLTPTNGYYHGDAIDFKLEFSHTYPRESPLITCLSDIYHPNIDISTVCESNVCLNLLDDDFWCPGFGLQGCIFGLLFLLENPNFEDPISPYFQPRQTLAEYINDIKNHRQGKKVGFLENLLDEVIGSSSEKLAEKENEKLRLTCDSTCLYEETDSRGKETIFPYLESSSKEKDESGNNTVLSDLQNQNQKERTPKNDDLVSQKNDAEMGADVFSPYKDSDLRKDDNRTKRQITEDSIVEASNKIFLKASGEDNKERKIRKLSVDEELDFEEMMYSYFDVYTETAEDS